MPRRKRQYIDKRTATTWHLFDRAQTDLMCGDGEQPQVTMVQVQAGEAANQATARGRGQRLRQEEREKFGIFYDDDYDYMQHLRPRLGQTVVEEEAGGEESESESESEGESEGESKGESKGGFVVPVELLPAEPSPAAAAECGMDRWDCDAEFFDPEIAEALERAEADGEGEEVEEIEDDFVLAANAPDSEADQLNAQASKADIFNRFFGHWPQEEEDDDEDEDEDNDVEKEDQDKDDNAEADEPSVAKAAAYPAGSVSVASSRRNRPLTYHEEVLEEQFDRLLREFQSGEDDDDPGAADDCSSAVTKSNRQALAAHEAEAAAQQPVRMAGLDCGRLGKLETLAALDALREEDEDEEDEEEDDAILERWYSHDRREPIEARCPPMPQSTRGLVGVSASLTSLTSAPPQHRPLLLDPPGSSSRASRRTSDSRDEDDCDNEDFVPTSKGSSALSSLNELLDRAANTEDPKERKRLVKQYQRERRQQKKLVRRQFAKAKAESDSRAGNEARQLARVPALA